MTSTICIRLVAAALAAQRCSTQARCSWGLSARLAKVTNTPPSSEISGNCPRCSDQDLPQAVWARRAGQEQELRPRLQTESWSGNSGRRCGSCSAEGTKARPGGKGRYIAQPGQPGAIQAGACTEAAHRLPDCGSSGAGGPEAAGMRPKGAAAAARNKSRQSRSSGGMQQAQEVPSPADAPRPGAAQRHRFRIAGGPRAGRRMHGAARRHGTQDLYSSSSWMPWFDSLSVDWFDQWTCFDQSTRRRLQIGATGQASPIW